MKCEQCAFLWDYLLAYSLPEIPLYNKNGNRWEEKEEIRKRSPWLLLWTHLSAPSCALLRTHWPLCCQTSPRLGSLVSFAPWAWTPPPSSPGMTWSSFIQISVQIPPLPRALPDHPIQNGSFTTFCPLALLYLFFSIAIIITWHWLIFLSSYTCTRT